MKIRLESGEDAVALGFDGSLFKLLSPRAFAPGSPIGFAAASADGERSFEGRALGSKRVSERDFEVRMRFVNLRREDRKLLLSTFGC